MNEEEKDVSALNIPSENNVRGYIKWRDLEDRWTKEVQKAQKIKEVLRQKKESALDTAYRVGHGVADDSE